MVTGGHDKSLIIHNGQGKLVRSKHKAHDHIIRALTIYHGPGTPMVISGSWDGKIKCWELLNNGKLVRTLSGHDNRVKSIKAISEHDIDSPPLLLSGSDDCTIKVWDLSNGDCLRTISSHKHFITDLALVGNSAVVSSSSDKTVLVHDIATGRKWGFLDGHGKRDVTSLLYVSPEEGDKESPLMCSGDSVGVIRAFEVGEILAHAGGGGGGGGEKVLSPLFILSGHTSKVTGMCVSLSASTPLLFSVSDDGFLRSWSLSDKCAGAIEADFGEDSARGCAKKGRERVHLLSCATTPTIRTSGDEVSTALPADLGVKVKASEELMIVGTDGFVLLLSIATLVPEEAAVEPRSVPDPVTELGGAESGEVIEGDEPKEAVEQEGSHRQPTHPEEAMVASIEGAQGLVQRATELQPDGTAPPLSIGTVDSANGIDMKLTSREASIGTRTRTDCSSSLLATVGDGDLLLTHGDTGTEGVRSPLNPHPHEELKDAPPDEGGYESKSVRVAGTGRQAARVLSGVSRNKSSTAAARERVQQRLAERNGGQGGRGRRVIQQKAGLPPPSLLLESGPRE